jgi:putative transposase
MANRLKESGRFEKVAGNLTKHGIDQLTTLVKTPLKRMQYRPGLIDGFLAKTGLDLTLT